MKMGTAPHCIRHWWAQQTDFWLAITYLPKINGNLSKIFIALEGENESSAPFRLFAPCIHSVPAGSPMETMRNSTGNILCGLRRGGGEMLHILNPRYFVPCSEIKGVNPPGEDPADAPCKSRMGWKACIFLICVLSFLLSLNTYIADATVTTVGTPAFENVQSGMNGVNGTNIYLGGTGGNGGGGDWPNAFTLTTTDNSNTTLSQAVYGAGIGGNGGHGGGSYGFTYDVGGDGGPGGGGGSLTINNSNLYSITTQGDSSVGIFGMSQAGNGGNGGDADGIYAKGGAGGAPGPGGVVDIYNYGAIKTSGVTSHGIFGQSTGGMGGNGGNAGGIWGGGGSGSTAGSGAIRDHL